MVNSEISSECVIEQNGSLVQTCCYGFLEPLACFVTRNDKTQLSRDVIEEGCPLDPGAMWLKLQNHK